jgi:hypothetical protein
MNQVKYCDRFQDIGGTQLDFKDEMKDAFLEAKIADLWKTRFHRADKTADKTTRRTQTKGWMFFLSRPAIELLRKMGPETEGLTEFLRSEINAFLTEKGNAKDWISTSFDKKITIETNVNNLYYATIIYPFSLANEVKGKHGVFVHLGKNEIQPKPAQDVIRCETPPTMFDDDEESEFIRVFNERYSRQSAPGTEWSDPMWSEFSGSKILPTDILLDNNWKEFNQVLNYQFIEIRLLTTAGDERKRSSSEQIDALDAFQSTESGFINFSGAPGTGKSTMLHMVCADRLAKNWAISEDIVDEQTRIMYYVPSTSLKHEASREIRAILTYIYRLDEQDTEKQIQNIVFQTPEDLYVTTPPSPKYNLQGELANHHLRKMVSGFKEGSPEGFNTRVRRFILGLFETPRNYWLWNKNQVKMSPTKEERFWTETRLNLNNPNTNQAFQKMHPYTAQQFLDYYNEKSTFENNLKQIESFLQTTATPDSDVVFWDHTSMINVAAKTPKNWQNTLWETHQGKIDYLIVDEIQDFNISEIRNLLHHFSNRQEGNQYREFRFICAGDENQNVNHLIYIPRNDHFRGLYENWWISLNQFTAITGAAKTKISLAHGLDSRKAPNFLSSYRVFDEMLPYAQHVLDELESLYVKSGKAGEKAGGKGARIEKTVFGRKGVFLVPKLRKNDQGIDNYWMEEILEVLRSQLEIGPNQLNDRLSTKPPAIRVSLSYSKSDNDMGKEFGNDNDEAWRGDKNPLTIRLLDEGATPWHQAINAMLNQFKEKFLRRMDEMDDDDRNANTKGNLLTEWNYELASRGIFSSQGIKGLTLPISIILPAKELKDAVDKHTSEALCEYLVQITRSQYLNVLLDQPEFVKAQNINTTLLQDDHQTWLSSILQHATGYEDDIAQIYQIALENNTNLLRWERLLTRSREDMVEDDNLYYLVVWLKKVYSELNNGSGLTVLRIEDLFHLETSGDTHYKINGLQLTANDLEGMKGWRLSLEKARDLEKYPLSGTRFDDDIVASLMLFFALNHLLRLEADQRASNKTFLSMCLRTLLNCFGSKTNQLTDTKHWLELLDQPTVSTDSSDTNKIRNLLRTTFHFEDGGLSNEWGWPSPALPRLYLGSWNLHGPRDDFGATEANTEAWLAPSQAYYTIPKAALIELLNLKRESAEVSQLLKVKMMISMNTLEAEEFLGYLLDYIDEQYRCDEEEKAIQMWNWFFEVINHSSCPKDFKTKVSDKLEQAVENRIKARQALATSIVETATIGEFVSKLEILKFKNWGNINMPRITEKIVEKAYQYILNTDAVVSVNAEIEQITAKELALEKKRNRITSEAYEKEKAALDEEKKTAIDTRINVLREFQYRERRTSEPHQEAEYLFSTQHPIHNLLTRVFNDANSQDDAAKKSLDFQERMFSSLATLPIVLENQNFTRLPMERIRLPSFASSSTDLSTAYIGCLDYWTVYTPTKEELDKFNPEERLSAEETKKKIAQKKGELLARAIAEDLKQNQEGLLKGWFAYIVSANKLSNLAGERGVNGPSTSRFNSSRDRVGFLSHVHNQARKSREAYNWLLNVLFCSEVPESKDGWQDFLTNKQASVVYALVQNGFVNENVEIMDWNNERFDPNFADPHLDEGGLLKGIQIPWNGSAYPEVFETSPTLKEQRTLIPGLIALLEDDITHAIALFEQTGAHNISTALKLIQLVDRGLEIDDFETEIIQIITAALRHERHVLLDKMYEVFGRGNQQTFARYRYGATVTEGVNLVERVFDLKPAEYRVNKSGTKDRFEKFKDYTIKNSQKHQDRLNFLELHDRFENMERLADAIEDIWENNENTAAFITALKQIDVTDFTVFKKKRAVKYTWKWTKKGYVPLESIEDDQVPAVIAFITEVLENPQISRDKFAGQVVELTGVKGIVRDHLLPPEHSVEAREAVEREEQNSQERLYEDLQAIAVEQTQEFDNEALENNKEIVQKIITMFKAGIVDYIDQELDRITGVRVKEALRARLDEYNLQNG